jgi:hypothetical protein
MRESMRSITISTEVFARIWSLRQQGEETEDAILRRVLPGTMNEASEVAIISEGTMRDRRSGANFPEAFEIFRTYLGRDYKAHARAGRWVLEHNGQAHASLNELSKAVGAKTENAWANWYFNGPDGTRRAVSELRDPLKIAKRKLPVSEPAMSSSSISRPASAPGVASEHHNATDATWRDDVREALKALGGKAPLQRLYSEVEAVRRRNGRSVPRSLEAVVRRTLEDHSSDSEAFRGAYDVFFMVEHRGAGVWGLRQE